MTIPENLKSLFRRRSIGARSLIIGSSVVFAIAFYTYVVDFYNPERNIFNVLKNEPTKYTFYSAGPGGTYFQIGEGLISSNSVETGLELRNEITAGGSENAIKVLTNPSSFGLVQEETIRNDDFIRGQLKYITPLYMERMHIVYRKSARNADFIPRISSNTDLKTLEFLARANISVGPVGSGTRVLASYVLNEVNSQIKESDKVKNINQTINNLKAVDAYEGLQDEDGKPLDVMFMMAGAPLSEVASLLANDKYGLISIDPSFVASVNKTYGLNLRLSDFKGIYPKNQSSTFGSYCFLISSKDVPNSDIMKLLNILNGSKGVIRTNLGIDGQNHFQLNEFDFISNFEVAHNERRITILKDVMFFIISFSFSLVMAASFLLWVSSSRKQTKYYKEISEVINNNLPFVSDFEDLSKSVYYKPVVDVNQRPIINKVIKGLSRLSTLQYKISDDYMTGGISDGHYTFLESKMDSLKRKLRKSLFLRLHEMVVRNGDKDIDAFYLLQLLTADYLLQEDYDRLVKSL